MFPFLPDTASVFFHHWFGNGHVANCNQPFATCCRRRGELCVYSRVGTVCIRSSLFYQSLGLHLADTCTGTGSLSAGTELFAGYSGKSYSGYSSLGFSVLGIYSTVVGYAARCVIRSFSAH